MSSLLYILIRSAKNGLLALLKKPAKLMMYLFIIAMMAFLLFMPALTQQQHDGAAYAALFWLKGIFFLFIMLFVVIAVQKGLTSGDSIFEMSDVNLLFVSPVSPKKILMYGILRLIKIAFLSGFFILFQGSSLGNGFGVTFGGLLTLLGAFMLGMIFLSILSIVLYSLTNGRPRRKLAVRVIAALCVAPLIVYCVTQYFIAGDPFIALERALHSPLLTWIPAAGWVSEGAIALLEGNVTAGMAFLGLTVAASALLVLYITFSKTDYYEDVLVATETAYEKKRAAQSGNVNAASAQSNKRVKVAKTGIGGLGATALLSKHLRESFRENRFGFLNITSVIIILGAAAAAYLVPKGEGLVLILQVLMWMNVFFIGTGRGLKELYLHYIYMIPEPSIVKIVWGNAELAFKSLIEAALIFGVAGVIQGEGLPVILAAIAAYTLFSLLLIAVNCLSLRWTGADLSAGLLIVIYMLAVLVIMAPGVVTALITGFAVGGAWGVCLGLCILCFWELMAALACFALAKGALDNCDMPVMKTGK